MSSHATSCNGERVLVAVSLNRLDSIPEIVLKSLLRREILLLSLGLRDFVFLRLDPNTILLVLWEIVGLVPSNTAITTSVRGSPTISKHCL